MKYRANKDEILSVLKREGSEVFDSDIDLMYDLLSEYYYNGIDFNVVKSTNPSGAYQAMTEIKRNTIKGVFGDKNSVSIDIKKFTANEESQLRHRKDMIGRRNYVDEKAIIDTIILALELKSVCLFFIWENTSLRETF